MWQKKNKTKSVKKLFLVDMCFPFKSGSKQASFFISLKVRKKRDDEEEEKN